jgi:biotin transport system substrate-specific component
VNKELAEPINSSIATPVAGLRTAGKVLAGTALVAVCAHAAVPLIFTPVPLTLQTFAVLLLGLLLSPRMAAVTLSVYLLEGAAGLPVFAPSPASGGLAHLIGPTGGYLLAYPAAAALVSWLYRKATRTRGFSTGLLSAAAGSLLILGCGAAWLSVMTHAPIRSVMAVAVFPFLPGDALKIALAATAAAGFQRLRHRTASNT